LHNRFFFIQEEITKEEVVHFKAQYIFIVYEKNSREMIPAAVCLFY